MMMITTTMTNLLASTRLLVVDDIVRARSSQPGGVGGRHCTSRCPLRVSSHGGRRRIGTRLPRGRRRTAGAARRGSGGGPEHCPRTLVRPRHGSTGGAPGAATGAQRQRGRHEHAAGRHLPRQGRRPLVSWIVDVGLALQLPHQLLVVHRQALHRLRLALELPQQVLVHLRQLPVQ